MLCSRRRRTRNTPSVWCSRANREENVSRLLGIPVCVKLCRTENRFDSWCFARNVFFPKNDSFSQKKQWVFSNHLPSCNNFQFSRIYSWNSLKKFLHTCDSIAFCFRWFFFCEQPSQPLQVQFPRFSHKKIKHRRHRRKDFGLQSRWSQTISERDAAVSVYAKHNLVNNVFASTTTGFSRLLIFCRFSKEKIHQNFWQYPGVKKVLRQTKKIPLLTRGRVNFISGSIICLILSARITRPRITKFNYEI